MSDYFSSINELNKIFPFGFAVILSFIFDLIFNSLSLFDATLLIISSCKAGKFLKQFVVVYIKFTIFIFTIENLDMVEK